MKHILNIIVVSLFILLGLSFFLESCYTPKILEKKANKACLLCSEYKGNKQIKDSFYTIIDTFLVPEDSAYYKAYIECVNGVPIIKHDTIIDGKLIKYENATLDNGYLTIKATIDTFYKIDSIQGRDRLVTNTVDRVVPPKDYKTWKTLGIIGIVSFSLLIIGIIIGIVIKIQK
jgi:hypothetical protein